MSEESALMLIVYELKQMRSEQVSIKQELCLLRKFVADEIQRKRFKDE